MRENGASVLLITEDATPEVFLFYPTSPHKDMTRNEPFVENEDEYDLH